MDPAAAGSVEEPRQMWFRLGSLVAQAFFVQLEVRVHNGAVVEGPTVSPELFKRDHRPEGRPVRPVGGHGLHCIRDR